MKWFPAALVSGALLIPVHAIVAVPEIPFKVSPGVFSLQNLNSILLDPRYANATDSEGQTLVPPTLSEFAHTFQQDLKTTLGLQVPVESSESALEGSIFITLSNNTTRFRDAAGRATSEGYQLEIGEAVTISGASPLGAWWGTRSVLQLAVLNEKQLNYGIATDSPGWANRGLMLDAGRHFYPPSFIQELCSYLSFFKQNTLQLHMSDNLNNYPQRYSKERTLSLYSAFRPWSDNPALAGLSPLKNESYSRQDLEDMQRACAARGVTIVPEIEAPGHALSIVKWKPQLGLEDLSMLNISHPETIPAVKMIWSTLLPWFHSKTVHIGADEYDKRHIRDYARFVNEIAEHILSESGKKVRIWGTFTPSQGSDVSKNVMQQHWANYDDNAYWDFIKNDYQVLNAYNYFYIVNKWSATYMPPLSKSKAFTGSPSHGQFSPNIFDVTNVTNNPPRSDPNVHGHLVCLWNDWGPNGTTVLEAFHAFRDALPAMADKQWGGNLTEAQYDKVMESLQASAPGQNLERRIKSKTSTILDYRFLEPTDGRNEVEDYSGNNYHGKIQGHGCRAMNKSMLFSGDCWIETPLGSKGRDFTLSFSVKPQQHQGKLFDGPDSTLTFDHQNLTMISGGIFYTLNYTLPLDTWTDVNISRKNERTYLSVSGGKKMEFLTVLGIWGQGFVWAPMAFEAPVASIGSKFVGEIGKVTVIDKAL
ncbi:hypothetical protein MY3296_009300 [Beauveria thailandica]